MLLLRNKIPKSVSHSWIPAYAGTTAHLVSADVLSACALGNLQGLVTQS